MFIMYQNVNVLVLVYASDFDENTVVLSNHHVQYGVRCAVTANANRNKVFYRKDYCSDNRLDLDNRTSHVCPC